MKLSLETLVPRLCFLLLFFMLAFGYGLAVYRYQWWPFNLLYQMQQATTSLLATGEFHPKGRVMPRPDYAADEAIQLHQSQRRADGLVAIMAFDNRAKHDAIWLFDRDGQLHHRWPIDYAAIVPDDPAPTGIGPHGLLMLPDGSAVVTFNADRFGLARIDACGRPLWVKEGFFHHSVDLADDGSLWTWGATGGSHAQQQQLVNIDTSSGDTLESIDLIDDIIRRSPRNRLAFSIPAGYRFKPMDHHFNQTTDDIFHPNDLEVLSAADAPHYPNFAAGDLMISLRTLDLVAILDPVSKHIKWVNRGPWLAQHDPDFNARGTITVFNNYRGLQHSSIVEIDPISRDSVERFNQGNAVYYTKGMGSHQLLPTGGALIVSSREGRVLEVDAKGDVLFEFNNIATDTNNAIVQNAEWLPRDFYRRLPQCPDNQLASTRE